MGTSPTLKVSQKMAYMTSAKMGSPSSRWTSTASIWSVQLARIDA